MRDRIKETLADIRLRGAQYTPKRENVAVMVLVLLMAASGIAVAQEVSERTWTDDFEDGDIDGWEGEEDHMSVSEQSVNGNYSLEATDDLNSQDGNPEWVNGPVLDLEDDFSMNGTVYVDQGSDGYRTGIGIARENENENAEGALLLFSDEYTATFLAETNVESPNGTYVDQDYDDTWVNYRMESDAGNTTVRAKVWEHGTAEPSAWNIEREMEPDSGQLSVFVGTADAGRVMRLDDVTIQGTEQTNANLTLEHNRWMDYGETQPYSVVFKNETMKEDVTDNATVDSMNTSVVTFDNEDHTMTAVNDTSVNTRVSTRAEWNGTVDYSYVVVASKTVDNLEILPPIYRFSATIGDDTIFFLIVAMLSSVVATRFTTAFGGISVYQVVVMMGWFSGWLSFGLMLLITMCAIFIGLNLAANINYGTMGGMAGRVR